MSGKNRGTTGGGNSRQRRLKDRQLGTSPSGEAKPDPLVQQSSPNSYRTESLLNRFIDWDGISFVSLCAIAFFLFTIDEFDATKWCFIAASIAAAIKITKLIRAQGWSRVLSAVVVAFLAGVIVIRVNSWVTSREIVAENKQNIPEHVTIPREIIHEIHDRAPMPIVPKPGSDPGTRGYLRSVGMSLRLDLPSVYVKISTINIGRLQIFPHATIFGYIRIRPHLTEAEEESLFGTFNVGGGEAKWMRTYNNYWESGDRKTEELSGSIDFKDPADLQQQLSDLQSGDAVIYVFVRHLYEDKLGPMGTESCFYVKGPDFGTPNECYDHNGPSRWRGSPRPIGTPSQNSKSR